MFPTYVKEQLRYKAMNYVRGLISKNHEVMNYSVEFTDESHEHKEEKDSKETLEMIMNDYKEYEFLTEREKIILGAMLEELDIKVIAERLNLTESSIYKIKKTISKKLKEHLEL
jgi:DNA-binding NarL/FixJ family response regulator